MAEFKDKNFTKTNFQTLNSDSLVKMGGSTAVSALIVDKKIIISNLGDSRCIIVENSKRKAKVVLTTKDHKPDNKEEKRRIEKASGHVTNNRVNGNLNLSRCLGDFEYKNNKNMSRFSQQVITDPDIYE